MKVYNYNHEVVFEGEVDVCRKFILDHLRTNDSGTKTFRLWQDSERHYVDVGQIFYTLEEVFPLTEE